MATLPLSNTSCNVFPVVNPLINGSKSVEKDEPSFWLIVYIVLFRDVPVTKVFVSPLNGLKSILIVGSPLFLSISNIAPFKVPPVTYVSSVNLETSTLKGGNPSLPTKSIVSVNSLYVPPVESFLF